MTDLANDWYHVETGDTVCVLRVGDVGTIIAHGGDYEFEREKGSPLGRYAKYKPVEVPHKGRIYTLRSPRYALVEFTHIGKNRRPLKKPYVRAVVHTHLRKEGP